MKHLRAGIFDNLTSHHLIRVISIALGIGVLGVGTIGLSRPANADDLPPAPKSMAEVAQFYKLYLDLIINQYPAGKVIPVVVKGDDYYIQKSTFSDLGINLPINADEGSGTSKDAASSDLTDRELMIMGFANHSSDWINLKKLPEIIAQYDSANQRIYLTIPAEWMPTQIVGRDTWYNAEPAQSGVGLLNNYEFYTYKPQNGDYTSSLFTEQRFFSPFGVLKNNGIYTFSNGDNSDLNDGYIRYETTFQYDHQRSATSILLGDVVSANKNTWGSSVRLGGVQIQRNFSVRPDLITYPLPQFTGQAALPSTIDLIINGQKASTTNVQSGPFIINNIPFMTGSGDAVVVTTDATGRQIATTVPFYISNSLLKEKLWDYSVSLGKIREDFGIKNGSYGDFAASADARYGLTNWLTLEGRSELTDDLQLFGVGTTLKIGRLGILSSSFSRSSLDNAENFISESDKNKIKGNQFTFGYSYHRSQFGFNLSHTKRDKDYMNLSRLTASDLISVNSNNSTTANVYFSKKKLGTFGVGYIYTKYSNNENKLLNFSWAPVMPPMMRGATMALSASNDLVSKEWTAALQFSLPLFKRKASVNYAYNKSENGHSNYLNFNRPIPSGGGFGVDLTTRVNDYGDNKTSNQAQLSYRNQYVNAVAGIAGSDDYSSWFGLSGSAIIMKQGVFLSNRLGDSFALIDANRIANVPVSYENGIIGRTNRWGYMFVPSIAPYYTGKFSINPLDLPSSYIITDVERRMAAKRGSGIVVKFPIKKTTAAMVYLVLENGQSVPVGSIVHRSDYDSSYVGIDGIAFLQDLQPQNTIRVQLPNQAVCEAKFAMNREASSDEQISTIKNVTCREVNFP